MKPTHLIVHHTDSWWGDLEFLNRIHQERGFKPSMDGKNHCGYHLFIMNGYPSFKDLEEKNYRPDYDGTVVRARTDYEIGQHVRGMNDRTLGIALVGKFNSLIPSVKQLLFLVQELSSWSKMHQIPVENILGHNEAQSLKGPSFYPESERKTCPGSALDMCWIRENVWKALR